MPSYTCTRCHKPIKDPTSVENGFGPACFTRLKKTIEEKQGVDPLLTFIHAEGDNPDIVLQRDNCGNACTNVRQYVARHSATGFDWGANNGGSDDLAYNILLHFGIKGRQLDNLYHRFQLDFLANISHAGGIIEATTINKWINEYAH